MIFQHFLILYFQISMALDLRVRVHNSNSEQIHAFSAKVIPQDTRYETLDKMRRLVEDHFDLGVLGKHNDKITVRDLEKKKCFSVDNEEQYQIHLPNMKQTPDSYDFICKFLCHTKT